MSKVRDHSHKLKRTEYASGTKVYFCIDDCSYKVEVPFALGKLVRCNICNQEFQMNEYSCKLARPHCGNCGKIQVKDEEGKRRFVSRNRPQQAIADLAKSAVTDMKSRMTRVVEMAKDEDI